MKRAVDTETLLIESEASEFGSDTLVTAQSSTSSGSYITGIAYVPAPDVQDRKVLSAYRLSATQKNSKLALVNKPGSGLLFETDLSGRCEFAFKYHHYDAVNIAGMSLGESHDRLTLVGVNNTEFTEPALDRDFMAYFEIKS